MSDSGDSRSGELAHKTRELRQSQPQASVVVDLTPMKPIATPRSTATLPVHRPRGSGTWLVVLVYVIATAALALSIYTRFF